MAQMVNARCVLALVTAALVIAGCDGDRNARSVTASAPTGYPGARTGVPDVDRIVDAVLLDDAAALRSLIRFTNKPCTLRADQVALPHCRPGEAEGATVDSLPQVITGSCRIAVWMMQDRADEITGDGTPFAGVRLYTVYHGALSPGNDAYTAVFVKDVDDPDFALVGASLHIEAGRIDGLEMHCGHTAAEMVQGVAADEFLVHR